jgi:hypothetical protein
MLTSLKGGGQLLNDTLEDPEDELAVSESVPWLSPAMFDILTDLNVNALIWKKMGSCY